MLTHVKHFTDSVTYLLTSIIIKNCYTNDSICFATHPTI